MVSSVLIGNKACLWHALVLESGETMLQFCVSQQLNDKPYAFKGTGIKVYSFEETLYHMFHHWRESVDDFLSDAMISWMADIGHSYLASRMKELSRKESFTTRLLDFLGLVDYFSPTEIKTLKTSLTAWEHRREWEKLKERADFFADKNEPAKAMPLYRRALGFEENAALLNNMGVACMQLGAGKDAVRYMTRALALAPDNLQILLHYTEAAILNGQFEHAEKSLTKAAAIHSACADIPYLKGLMAYEKKEYMQALTWIEDAITMDHSVIHYVYKLADIYIAMRQYSKAIDALVRAKDDGISGAELFKKEAEIHAASGDISAAIRAMRMAAELSSGTDATILAKLAGYYRQDYDSVRAEAAIVKALSIDPENDIARLENARIKKSLGRTRDYQTTLGDILKGFRGRYRSEAL